MSHRYERLLQKILSDIEAISHQLLTSRQPLTHRIFTQEGQEDWGRGFANLIYDMPAIWSGSASVAACRKKARNFKYKPSKDHYNSRQRCGEELVLLIRKRFGQGRAPTRPDIEMILIKARGVHYVTSQENRNAQPFMAKGMTPKRAYKAAGIELVHDTERLFSKRGRKSLDEIRELRRIYL